MKRFYVFFVLVFVLMLFGCKKSVLHRADSGKTFTYSLGEEFSISLSENLSTGYTWHFKTIPATQMVVSFLSDRYDAPKTNRVGAGGQRVFLWQAVTAGEVEIQGFYARPWAQSKEEPSVVYKIIVK